MRKTKIHFGHYVGKYDPSTELPRDIYAGVCPLQLGVVLVLYMFMILQSQCFSAKPLCKRLLVKMCKCVFHDGHLAL